MSGFLQDGELLPIESVPGLMRTGYLAERLVRSGCAVIWWTPRYNRSLKIQCGQRGTNCELRPSYQWYLLDGPGYRRNVSK